MRHLPLVLLYVWMTVFVSDGYAQRGARSEKDARVEATLSAAGENRSNLQGVLDHYALAVEDGKDADAALKLDAARYLIANMEGQGFVLTAFYDAKKVEVPFEALDYKNYGEAQAAMDSLEKEHGSVDYGKKRLDSDAATMTAELLIENIEWAFKAWRERPWAKGISYETFRDHILPYRGSEEPIGSTRPELFKRYDDIRGKMKDASDLAEAAALIRPSIDSWMGFSELYYLHPTDLSFAQMREQKRGRCEDITNAVLYSMRANAIPVAGDYTPWWANRDNNHAWEVILDKDGKGHAGLSNRAAKVYRKTFATQPNTLADAAGSYEKLPKWIAKRTYADVTEQYQPVSEVHVYLTAPIPSGTKIAYICVFNGGEWRVIDWAKIQPGIKITLKGSMSLKLGSGSKVSVAKVMSLQFPYAKFKDMGRGIAYIAAYWSGDAVVPASNPFILDERGEQQMLNGDEVGTAPSFDSVEIAATVPTTPDADTKRDKPLVKVEADVAYDLKYWKDGKWESMGTRQAAKGEHAAAVTFEKIPTNRLLWITTENGRKLERIFTIEKGRRVWW